MKNSGGILSVDDASELIDVYQKNKSENRIATNVVASKLVEQAFNHKLNNLDPKKDNIAYFTAGGPASFKSSMAEKVVFAKGDNPQFIFDSNLANSDTAVSLIDKTLNKGLNIHIAYSYRNIMDAWKSNLERAGKHERVVALNTFIRNHLEAPETLIKLQEKYQDNPNVGFTLYDNSQTSAKEINFEKLKSLLYNDKQDDLDIRKISKVKNNNQQSVRTSSIGLSRAQKETSLKKQAKAIAAEQFKNRAISEQVYRGALRGHLNTQNKPQASSPAKQSQIEQKEKQAKLNSSPTKQIGTKTAETKKEHKSVVKDKNSAIKGREKTTEVKKQEKSQPATAKQISQQNLKDKSTKVNSQKQQSKLTKDKLISKVEDFTSPDVFAKVYKDQGFSRPQLIELYQKEKARLKNRSNNQKLKEEKAKNQKVISRTDEEVATKFALAQQVSHNEIELAKIDLDEIYKEYQSFGGDYSLGDYKIENKKQEAFTTVWKTPELLRLARELGTDVNVKSYIGKAMGVFYAKKCLN